MDGPHKGIRLRVSYMLGLDDYVRENATLETIPEIQDQFRIQLEQHVEAYEKGYKDYPAG